VNGRPSVRESSQRGKSHHVTWDNTGIESKVGIDEIRLCHFAQRLLKIPLVASRVGNFAVTSTLWRLATWQQKQVLH